MTGQGLSRSEFDFAGTRSGPATLLGLDGGLQLADFASPEKATELLTASLDRARMEGLLGPNTIVVLPEHWGSWLVASYVPKDRLSQISSPIHLLEILLETWHPEHLTPITEHPVRAWIRAHSEALARTYQQVLSTVSRTHQTTLVGGSILLAGARVENGQIRTTPAGPIHNLTAVFGPSGAPYPDLVRKCRPTREEKNTIDAADPNDLPVFETPAGRLGVLVCADSWFPECYAALALKHPDLIAVPAFLMGLREWLAPWPGINGWPTPRDIGESDISEREAWARYSLPGRITQSGARAGITTFQRTPLFTAPLGGEHLSASARNENPKRSPFHNSASLAVWA